jgi:hypothetical protein
MTRPLHKVASALICTLVASLLSCATNNGSTQPSPRSGARSLSAPHADIGPHGGPLQPIGERHLELLFDPKSGAITVYVLDSEARTPALINAANMSIVIPAPENNFIEASLAPIPDAQAPTGKFSTYSAEIPAIKNTKIITPVIRTAIESKTYRARFYVDTTKPADKFVCPMGCEGPKSYAALGRCPVCKMALVSNRTAHGDHSPKHGGLFFMAPNGWHHLEGSLPVAREFRIYLYNNFTRAIPATSIPEGSTIDGEIVDETGKTLKEFTGLPLKSSGDGTFLAAELPDYAKPPIRIAAHINFNREEPSVLFNFSFTEITKSK